MTLLSKEIKLIFVSAGIMNFFMKYYKICTSIVWPYHGQGVLTINLGRGGGTNLPPPNSLQE